MDYVGEKVKIMSLSQKAEIFAIKAHADTNHYYDKYLPYEFHLRMVHKIIMENIAHIPEEDREDVIAAAWLHDTIEDARVSYADIQKQFNGRIAEIVRACTNYGRGRTREERMPDFCYEDIRNTKYATYVKLADRTSNIQYSILTAYDSDKSSMLSKYKKEHAKFSDMLRDGKYDVMWNKIETLLHNSN